MTAPPHNTRAPRLTGQPLLRPIDPVRDDLPIAAYCAGEVVEIVALAPCPEEDLTRTPPSEGDRLGAVSWRGTKIGYADSEVFYAHLADDRRWPISTASQVKLSDQVEGHYPTCGRCGDLWPCRHATEVRTAQLEAAALESSMRWYTEHPVPCGRDGCDERFRTERGRDQHHARSGRHPIALRRPLPEAP